LTLLPATFLGHKLDQIGEQANVLNNKVDNATNKTFENFCIRFAGLTKKKQKKLVLRYRRNG